MKTKHEILDDVVKHIKKQGGISIDGNSCVYISTDGKTCGHSMALKPSFRVKANEMGNKPNARKVIELLTDKCHQKKYQGHSDFFWERVQDFHDDFDCWESDGSLSERGEIMLKEIKERFKA